MSQKMLKAGEALFQEGDQSKSAYFIKKGMIRIFKKKGEASVEIETLRAGALIGELAFLDNQPRSASAEAIVETEIVEISQTILDEALGKAPEWLKVLLKTVSNRLRTATNKIKQLESTTMEYETNQYGERSKEFVFVSKHELIRVLSGLMVVASRHGDDSIEGIKIPVALSERYCSQILHVHESKVNHLFEVLKITHLIQSAPEDQARQMVYLKDIEFIEKLVWFINEQNQTEASKQRNLSNRGFLLLNLLTKHLHSGDDLGEGNWKVNIATFIQEEGKILASPPLRTDELQELADQKIIDTIQVASANEINLLFQRDKVRNEHRIFWLLNELDKLNERKRKTK